MKIHIDIDCFFVSALRTKDATLKGKPVAIGGRTDTKIFEQNAVAQKVDFQNNGSFVPTFYKDYEQKDDDLANFTDHDGKIRGILTTASYEARSYGVKTAMRIEEALKLCPSLIIKAPNMTLFQQLSHQLHHFLSLEIPLVEQASIDEFFGDLSGWIKDDEVISFCKMLQQKINKELDLPVSIGIAKTRFIAKLATTMAKPYGVFYVNEAKKEQFLQNIPIEEFPGIGRSTKRYLYASGIYTLGELQKRKARLEAFGAYGKRLYRRIFEGEDEVIKPKKERKSIGISRTITPLYDRKELQRRVFVLARHLSFAVMKLEVFPTRYGISLKYEMGKKSSFALSDTTLFSETYFFTIVQKLLTKVDTYKQLHIIRISLYCTNFTKTTKKELDITTFYKEQKRRDLSEKLLQIREKYGLDIIKNAKELE